MAEVCGSGCHLVISVGTLIGALDMWEKEEDEGIGEVPMGREGVGLVRIVGRVLYIRESCKLLVGFGRKGVITLVVVRRDGEKKDCSSEIPGDSGGVGGNKVCQARFCSKNFCCSSHVF